jgi:NTP pyrophosphatase (non-canonical NTP hydrolase)
MCPTTMGGDQMSEQGGEQSIKQLQAEVDAWMSQFGGYWPPLANLARLTEEVGELAREINHAHGPKKKKGSEAPGSVAEELGDVLFVVIALANSMQIDLGAALDAVLAKYRVRDATRWTSPDEGGDDVG